MTKARDNASGGLGLILIKPSSVSAGATDNGKGTITFSSASSVSLNGIFNSTYDNYRLIFEVTSASANTDMNGRYRLNGSDASANSYSSQRILGAGASADSGTVNNTYMDFGTISTNTRYAMTIDFFKPFTTGQHMAISMQNYLTSSSVWVMRINGHRYDVATAYDSFSIYPTSGTITGQVSVYGYNK